MTPNAPDRPPQPRPFVPLRRTVLVLAVLYAVDLFGLGVGLLSLFTAFLGMSLLLLGGLLALLRKRAPLAGNRFRRAGIYAVLGLMAMGTGRLQTAVAQRHADQVVAACRRYRAERGAYPERLEDLVPGYLKAVPPVNYALMREPFRYSRGLGGPEAVPLLWYADVPGASRLVYSFNTGRWTHQD